MFGTLAGNMGGTFLDMHEQVMLPMPLAMAEHTHTPCARKCRQRREAAGHVAHRLRQELMLLSVSKPPLRAYEQAVKQFDMWVLPARARQTSGQQHRRLGV